LALLTCGGRSWIRRAEPSSSTLFRLLAEELGFVGRSPPHLRSFVVSLPKELESPLLGLEARLEQTLQGLLARSVLLATDNATLLGLHQVLLGQPTGSVLGRAVVDLSLGAHSGDLASATHHRGVILTRAVIHFILDY